MGNRNEYPNRVHDKYALLAMKLDVLPTDEVVAEMIGCKANGISPMRRLLIDRAGFEFELLANHQVKVVKRPAQYDGRNVKYPAENGKKRKNGILDKYRQIAMVDDLILPDAQVQSMLGGSGRGTFSSIRSRLRNEGFVFSVQPDGYFQVTKRPKIGTNGIHPEVSSHEQDDLLATKEWDLLARILYTLIHPIVDDMSAQSKLMAELLDAQKQMLHVLESLDGNMREMVEWLKS